MMLPSKLAVIKCQAHRKGNEMVSQDNNAKKEHHMCQTQGPQATSGPACNYIRPARSFYIIVTNGPAI